MIGRIFEGCAACGLEEILALKERRAAEVVRLGAFYGSPVICFKLNIAGSVKRFPLAVHFFSSAMKRISKALKQDKFVELFESVWKNKCGDTAFFVCKGDAHALKRLMCAIEDNAPGGRLYDIDVYSERGVPYTRDGLAMAQRPCLVCGGPAHFCARSRRHPLEEVLKETVGIMREALAGDIAAAAYGAMIRELRTTPKPGLVDRSNNGAHADMDYALFERSALAVSPYFKHMALYAMGFNGPPDEMLGGLRSIGLSAEEAMFSATGGVNTHKGLIFSFGLVCAAAAYLYTVNETADDGQLLRCAARIAAPSLDEMGACGDTHGQKIFLRHQLYGARGEAALGFPCVVETGLPALRRALAAGESENDAGVYALMHLMARLDDTNIIARSDIAALRRVQAQAEALLEKGLPAEAFLREVGQMDAQFIAQNISAGGCADMLAVCWLVYLLSH